MDFVHDQEMKIANIYSKKERECGLGDEDDDVFYEELRRQVLQLTAEEDEDGDHEDLYENKNPNIVQARRQETMNGRYGITKPRLYYDWPGNMDDCAAPAWILNLWRTGSGTGVFIPQIVQYRRRNRPRRKKSGGGKTYKQMKNMN